jgi:hypothetical protein
MGPNLLLEAVLKLELHQYADEVGDVLDRAQKEDKMESSIAKLQVSRPPYSCVCSRVCSHACHVPYRQSTQVFGGGVHDSFSGISSLSHRRQNQTFQICMLPCRSA